MIKMAVFYKKKKRCYHTLSQLIQDYERANNSEPKEERNEFLLDHW